MDEEEYVEFVNPQEIELDDIEGKDPNRAKFIRGYIKESMT